MPKANPAQFVSVAAVAALAVPAAAVDLTVQSIQVIQAVQYGTTRLISGKVTMVRATIGVSDSAAAVDGVDATLRMSVDGVESSPSPVYSLNGPISAPLTSQLIAIDQTINFLILAPVSADVDFTVEVNPNHDVPETDFANNSLTSANQSFLCRGVVECVYVPVNYQPLGAVPDPSMIEPGIGDGFVRAIYSPGVWNYHIAPLPPLLWTTPIGSSASALLNALRDIRTNILPDDGYPEPPFVFGWLPGNPFSGNGLSISVPGDVAFGNTDIARFQRTFAHELGHLVGNSHNNGFINTVGIDTEKELWDTESLPQVFGPEKRDVMVPGLLTHEAFVWANTYNRFLDDSRVQCPADGVAGMAGGAGGGAGPLLRVCGVITSATRAVVLDPLMRVDRGLVSPDNPRGNVLIIALDALGNQLLSLGYRTDTASELCVEQAQGGPQFYPQAPFHVLIPQTIAGRQIARIEIRDRASGQLLAERHRSAHAPQVRLSLVAGSKGGRLVLKGKAGNFDGLQTVRGHVRLEWAGSDPDGDDLTYNVLYSPNGGHSWLPLAVNRGDQFFEFDDAQVPASVEFAGSALIRLVASDGMNIAEDVSVSFALGTGSPPGVFLVSPNDGESILEHAPVAFHAAAWDMEDLMLTGEQIQWTSSIDGSIGSGLLFLSSALSPGDHTITVTGTDLDGMSASKSIGITVVPRDVVRSGSPADLNGDGVVNSLDLGILLSAWSIPASAPGCGGSAPCQSDLNRDGHVDSIDLGTLLSEWTL